jgi:hypothetical protein
MKDGWGYDVSGNFGGCDGAQPSKSPTVKNACSLGAPVMRARSNTTRTAAPSRLSRNIDLQVLIKTLMAAAETGGLRSLAAVEARSGPWPMRLSTSTVSSRPPDSDGASPSMPKSMLRDTLRPDAAPPKRELCARRPGAFSGDQRRSACSFVCTW